MFQDVLQYVRAECFPLIERKLTTQEELLQEKDVETLYRACLLTLQYGLAHGSARVRRGHDLPKFPHIPHRYFMAASSFVLEEGNRSGSRISLAEILCHAATEAFECGYEEALIGTLRIVWHFLSILPHALTLWRGILQLNDLWLSHWNATQRVAAVQHIGLCGTYYPDSFLLIIVEKLAQSIQMDTSSAVRMQVLVETEKICCRCSISSTHIQLIAIILKAGSLDSSSIVRRRCSLLLRHCWPAFAAKELCSMFSRKFSIDNARFLVDSQKQDSLSSMNKQADSQYQFWCGDQTYHLMIDAILDENKETRMSAISAIIELMSDEYIETWFIRKSMSLLSFCLEDRNREVREFANFALSICCRRNPVAKVEEMSINRQGTFLRQQCLGGTSNKEVELFKLYGLSNRAGETRSIAHDDLKEMLSTILQTMYSIRFAWFKYETRRVKDILEFLASNRGDIVNSLRFYMILSSFNENTVQFNVLGRLLQLLCAIFLLVDRPAQKETISSSIRLTGSGRPQRKENIDVASLLSLIIKEIKIIFSSFPLTGYHIELPVPLMTQTGYWATDRKPNCLGVSQQRYRSLVVIDFEAKSIWRRKSRKELPSHAYAAILSLPLSSSESIWCAPLYVPHEEHEGIQVDLLRGTDRWDAVLTEFEALLLDHPFATFQQVDQRA